MIDVLITVWQIFVGIVLSVVAILIFGFLIIKFFEFIKGKEGDDYKR